MITVIDVRISIDQFDRINKFILQYKGETQSSLINKAIRRFNRVSKDLESRQYKALFSHTTALNAGKYKASAKIKPGLKQEFYNQCKKHFIKPSIGLRLALAYYMETEPKTETRPLDLEKGYQHLAWSEER